MHFIKQKKKKKMIHLQSTQSLCFICECRQIYNFYATDTKKKTAVLLKNPLLDNV